MCALLQMCSYAHMCTYDKRKGSKTEYRSICMNDFNDIIRGLTTLVLSGLIEVAHWHWLASQLGLWKSGAALIVTRGGSAWRLAQSCMRTAGAERGVIAASWLCERPTRKRQTVNASERERGRERGEGEEKLHRDRAIISRTFCNVHVCHFCR